MIKPLDSATVRQICAGQVLNSLAGVVKELVENCMDAGATKVEVFVEAHGLSRVTVKDNGGGIFVAKDEPCALLSRRASSKRLSRRAPAQSSEQQSPVGDASEERDDDVSISAYDSLGFRGEALHSLAQLSTVQIFSKTEHAQETIAISYDQRDAQTIVSTEPNADCVEGDHGTTVRVDGLFVNFPVRRQEFERQKKKQLQDTVSLIKQYALSRPDVRVLLQHRLTDSDPIVTLTATSGSGDVQRSLAEAYGGRVVGSMTHVNWSLPQCSVSGLVSPVGAGRATSDMQAFSLDGRLVDLPKLSRTVTDAFVECHPSAAQRLCPAFFLRIETNGRTKYDVNLAPNKRKVLMEMEGAIIDGIREESLKVFRARSDFIELDREAHRKQLADRNEEKRLSLTLTPISATSPSLIQYRYRSQERSGSETGNDSSSRKRMREEDDAVTSDMRTSFRSSSREMTETLYRPVSTTPTRSLLLDDDDTKEEGTDTKISLIAVETTPSTDDPTQQELISVIKDRTGGEAEHVQDEDPEESGSMSISSQQDMSPMSTTLAESVVDETVCVVTDEGIDYKKNRRDTSRKHSSLFPSLGELATMHFCEEEVAGTPRDTDEEAGKAKKKNTKKKPSLSRGVALQTSEDLNQVLHKTSFPLMRIYGQFNHGFILASHDDDLFIIDQHASDEKYNYEQLVSKYAAKPQPLVRQVRVALEVRETELALEHKAALRSHGFLVQPVENEGEGGILVASVPVLPYDTVAPQDICELTMQLVQYGSIVRPLRSVWHSMATKACRSSIMIGAVLTDKMMRSIVDHLSTMDQPWNCPHGRPTLRHLALMSTLMQEENIIGEVGSPSSPNMNWSS